MEATWEDAFTIRLKDNKISVSPKEKTESSNTTRDHTLKDARSRMIARTDLCEDAAKGIDKATSLHLLRSRQPTQWQR